MTSSDHRAPAPASAGAGTTGHARFIPGEELGRYVAWSPTVFGPAGADGSGFTPLATGLAKVVSIRQPDGGLPADNDFALAAAQAAAAQAVPQPGQAHDSDPIAAPRDAQTAWREAVRDELQDELLAEWAARAEASQAEHQAQVQEARQAGYQDGYRDGLVALDSFKQSYAQQVTTQVGQLVITLDKDLTRLEAELAETVAGVATALARQVVRSELSLRPELVVQVAQEAVAALVKNARQVSISLHPDDHALVAAACTDMLAATDARLVPRADLARGGCLVESDLGSVDALVATRWAQAAGTLGSALAWDDSDSAPGEADTHAHAPVDPDPDADSGRTNHSDPADDARRQSQTGSAKP